MQRRAVRQGPYNISFYLQQLVEPGMNPIGRLVPQCQFYKQIFVIIFRTSDGTLKPFQRSSFQRLGNQTKALGAACLDHSPNQQAVE